MRQSIASLNEQFADLHRQWLDLIERVSPDQLYQPGDSGSCGEQVLRSAAIVEQSFGGITANLWDDPFEWTLPEALSTPEKVREYLAEVDATRRHAFQLFQSDEELKKEIMTPSGKTDLSTFLLDTLQRARHHQQRAKAIQDLLATR